VASGDSGSVCGESGEDSPQVSQPQKRKRSPSSGDEPTSKNARKGTVLPPICDRLSEQLVLIPFRASSRCKPGLCHSCSGAILEKGRLQMRDYANKLCGSGQLGSPPPSSPLCILNGSDTNAPRKHTLANMYSFTPRMQRMWWQVRGAPTICAAPAPPPSRPFFLTPHHHHYPCPRSNIFAFNTV